MLIVAIGLWTIAIIILIVKPHNKTFKVASGLAFVCGFSGIVDFLAVNAIAWSEKYNIPLEKLYFLQSILVTIPHFFGPLVILVYGMSCYNDLKKTHTKKIIYILLLIPVILSYIFLPYKIPRQLTQNELSNYFLFLSLWAVPYMACGNLLVFLRVIKEKSSSQRKYWFLNALMSIPFITYAIFANFILRIFHIENTFNLFKYFIPIQVILFLYFGVKYGILGVKIKVERHEHAIAKVFNYISDAVVITDPNLDIVEINKSFYEHFGNCKDLISLELLLDNTELKSYKDEILNIVKAKKTGLVSVNCNSKFFDLEITPIIKDYSFEGVFLIAKDVTQHKNNLILLKERQEELIEKEKYSTFSHLIGGIAHNLKTPLMASLGGIEILKKTTNFFKNMAIDNVPEKFTTSIAKKEKWEKIIQENLEYVSETITLIQK